MRLQEGTLGGPAKETGPEEERDLVVVESSSSCCYLLCDVRNINETKKKKQKKQSPPHNPRGVFFKYSIPMARFNIILAHAQRAASRVTCNIITKFLVPRYSMTQASPFADIM